MLHEYKQRENLAICETYHISLISYPAVGGDVVIVLCVIIMYVSFRVSNHGDEGRKEQQDM